MGGVIHGSLVPGCNRTGRAAQIAERGVFQNYFFDDKRGRIRLHCFRRNIFKRAVAIQRRAIGVHARVKHVISQFFIILAMKNLVYPVFEDIAETLSTICIHAAAYDIPVGENADLPENLPANKTHAARLSKLNKNRCLQQIER
jgi:hypothetical protein